MKLLPLQARQLLDRPLMVTTTTTTMMSPMLHQCVDYMVTFPPKLKTEGPGFLQLDDDAGTQGLGESKLPVYCHKTADHKYEVGI
jgi:hypothetical protein